MKHSRQAAGVALGLGLTAAVAAAVWHFTRPPASPPWPADEIGQQIQQQVWQQALDAREQFDKRAVTVWVEDAADVKAVQGQLVAAAGLGPTDRHLGYHQRGAIGMHRLAPVDDLEAFARRIDFGRVLAVDPETKTILVRHGAAPAPPPWGDGEVIRRRLPVTHLLNRESGSIDELAKKFGRDKVVTLRMAGMAQRTVGGWHAADKEMRALLDDPAGGAVTPWSVQPGGVCHVNVAPVGDVGRFARGLAFGKVTAVDAGRRAVFVESAGLLKEDTAALQGAWRVEKIEGQMPGKVDGLRVEVKGDKITLTGKTEKPLEFTFRLDPVRAPDPLDPAWEPKPPAFDITGVGTLLGVYRLGGDGNSLTVCYSELEEGEKGVRPMGLAAPAGSKRYLWELKR